MSSVINTKTKWSEYSGMYSLTINGIKFTVHKCVGLGDEYRLSCNELDISDMKLGTAGLEESKTKAIELILKELVKKINFYSDTHSKLYSIMCEE